MVKRNFRKALKDGALLFDGAMGTMLQKAGMEAGGCPDELCLTNPAMVRDIHKAFSDAGADIVTTNTFGSTRPKLEEYDLEDKIYEINKVAAEIAREAVGEDKFVAGDIGPTGLFMEPVGNLVFDDAVKIFDEQIKGLKDGGADLILIETMMDIKEVKAAVISAKSFDMPVVVTMTFDETFRSVLGSSPEVFAIVCEALQVDALGANCSLGIEGIYETIKKMATVTDLPLIAQANAGLPELHGTETIFPATPEDMVPFVTKLAAQGVKILGGCCGTTPEHISAMGKEFKALNFDLPRLKRNFTTLASRTEHLSFGGEFPPIVIGERINPTGRKEFSQAIKDGKTTLIRKEAKDQVEHGAHTLDINMGVPDIDEPAAMTRAVFCVNENVQVPIVIDSSFDAGLEAGLKAVDGKALVNSVSGETKKLDAVLPLVQKYGSAVLALTLDNDGIPDTAEERLHIAEEIVIRAEKLGIRRSDIVCDCLTMTVSAQPDGAVVTLDAIRLVKEKLGLSTVLGVSNISFGLPSRAIVNSNFLSMAIAFGLDSAIISPHNMTVMDAFYAARLLVNRDPRAERFIDRFMDRGKDDLPAGKGKKKPSKKAVIEEAKTIGDKLKNAIIEGDEEHILDFVEEAFKEGWSPIKISNEGLILGLNVVGELFGSNRYFLPQVILSADTMKKAFTRIKEEMKGDTGPKIGKVVMATVEGDIHDIGKNIVCTLLENHGFEVIDLGKNVQTDKVVETVLKEKPDIVGLSALMTTTVMEMDNVIKRLKEAGSPVKTIVGGAVVTPEFAERIGADAYGGEATEAVDKMKAMVKV